jgi:hypothetical protein
MRAIRAALVRWLTPRFSLRTFLLFVLILSVALGWLGKLYLRTRQQRAIIAQIKEAGGSVSYQPPGADFYQPTPPRGPLLLRQLVGDEAFAEVRAVQFGRRANVTDESLFVLLQLPDLCRVAVGGNRFTEEGVAHLAQLPKLRELDISNVTADGLRQLAAARELRELVLSWHDTDDAVLSGVAELTQLTSIQLYDTSVTANGLAAVSNLTSLEEINFLGSARIGEGALKHFAALPNVRTLMLCGTSIGDADLAELSKFRRLEGLNLLGTKATDAGMRFLSDCPALNSLALASAVTDEGVQSLRGLSHLEFLWIESTSVTDKSVQVFSGLEGLRRLLIHRTAITDTGARELSRLKNLQELWLGPQVTDEAAAELRIALPNCEIELYDAAGRQRPGK